MSEKKRRWFQIHLSTAVVMMFVAGGLVWANIALFDTVWFSRCYFRGFPFVMNETALGWATVVYWSKPDNLALMGPFSIRQPPIGMEGSWYVLPALYNLGFSGIVLVAVAFFSEYFIRCREARKP